MEVNPSPSSRANFHPPFLSAKPPVILTWRDRSEVASVIRARSLVWMVVTSASPKRIEPRRRIGRHADGLVEMLVGCALLSVATLAGLVFVRRPWPNRVDAIGLRHLPADPASGWARDVAHLGSSTALIAGVAVLCVVAALSRNWVRALSCLIAPVAAVLIVQTVAKPLVGRQLEGTLSYPSGTVTAVAALAAAAFVIVPRYARPIVAVVGGVVVAAACAAVVVLRWHYPTDAFGGVCVGAGFVFAVDGTLIFIRNQMGGSSAQRTPRVSPRKPVRP